MKFLRPRLTARSFFWQRGADRPAGAPAPDAGRDDGPKGPLVERVWAWLHRTFPERQVYIRSDGRVQFFTFGPSLQATMAGLALIFLGWVAFATVNVVFKDRIIAAKDHRYRQMQSAYENRLAGLQVSYDELNGALVGAEDKFKATADALAARQNAISGFLGRKSRIEAAIGAGTPAAPPALGKPAPGAGNMAGDSLDVAGPVTDTDSGSLVVMPDPPPPQPRVQKPERASLLERAWKAVDRFAASLFDRSGRRQAMIAAAYAHHPGLKVLAAETARVAAMGGTEDRLMAKTGEALERDVALLRDTVRDTGIDPDEFLRKGQMGEGGPDIPLDQVHISGSGDPSFDTAFLRASAVMDELDGMDAEVSRIPLALPVAGSQFDISSGFGPRLDPFTGHYAFHPGLDFAGPWGSPVAATAPGVVVFAGYRGAYGNMVEIDHGFGLHTRYAHLARVTVAPGMTIAKGTIIGRMGSTGRSTGPHVHYEVWYDNTLRNPRKFLEAGHHVL